MLAVTVLAAVAWLAAGAAAVAGWGPFRPAPPPTVPATADLPAAVAATGTAELAVATWLEAGGRYAARASAIDLAPAEQGRWTVTVAADVLRAEGDRYRLDGRRHYRVVVATDGGEPRAVTDPEELPDGTSGDTTTTHPTDDTPRQETP